MSSASSSVTVMNGGVRSIHQLRLPGPSEDQARYGWRITSSFDTCIPRFRAERVILRRGACFFHPSSYGSMSVTRATFFLTALFLVIGATSSKGQVNLGMRMGVNSAAAAIHLSYGDSY